MYVCTHHALRTKKKNTPPPVSTRRLPSLCLFFPLCLLLGVLSFSLCLLSVCGCSVKWPSRTPGGEQSKCDQSVFFCSSLVAFFNSLEYYFILMSWFLESFFLHVVCNDVCVTSLESTCAYEKMCIFVDTFLYDTLIGWCFYVYVGNT